MTTKLCDLSLYTYISSNVFLSVICIEKALVSDTSHACQVIDHLLIASDLAVVPLAGGSEQQSQRGPWPFLREAQKDWPLYMRSLPTRTRHYR